MTCVVDIKLLFMNWFYYNLITLISPDTNVFKTYSGRLKKVTTSYDQTRRPHDAWKLKTSYLCHLEDIQYTTSWRRLIYDVLKTSHLRRTEDIEDVANLRRIKNVWFTTSSARLIYEVLKTSNLRCFELVCRYGILYKSINWFICDRNLRNERVNHA